MSKHHIVAVSILLGTTASVGVAGLPAEAAGTEPAIHFVIDVSGSMSGNKLTQAVEAIQVTAEAVPDSTALGLRSYAGSCNQSTIPPLVPIGLDNDEAIIAAADGLAAGGGTPTTAALEVGLDELKAYETNGQKRLVLLTDGDTQCGISVCDFVQGYDLGDTELTLYTVGLQVSSGAAADLTCAAESTGGSFIPADDPEDLIEALGEAAGRAAAVAGLGDSIAAGHGVGVSTWNPNDPQSSPPVNKKSYPHLLADMVGERAVNYAISGACIGKRGDSIDNGSPFPISSKTADGCPDDNVNDQVKRLVESGQQPSIITLTVGGNDIRFSDCFRSALAVSGFESSSGSDPCSGKTFQDNLNGYEENLTNLYAFLRETYPDSEIFQTRQYAPLPVVPGDVPCRLFYMGYLIADPGGYGNHVKSGDLDEAVGEYAEKLLGQQGRVVGALNKRILRVTTKFGVLATTGSGFFGHDLCGQYENYEPYVLGPVGTATVSIKFELGAFDQTFNQTVSLTAKDSYENGTNDPCSDDPCYFLSDVFLASKGRATVTLKSADLRVNGAPHPNAAGQMALASAVLEVLY